jgi:nucleotide-binding universal stress UspA family protein
MKTILVPTDFSENAENAAKAAVLLCSKLDANMLLFNSYFSKPVTPQYAGGPWVVDELKELENESTENLREQASELEKLLAKISKGERTPVIKVRCGEGSLGDSITDTLNHREIEMIVIGARADSGINHIFYDSDTSSIIDRATCPVFILPPDADLRKLKKLVFATDFDEADILAVDYLFKLSKLFDFKLEVVHINLFGKNEHAKVEDKTEFIKHLMSLKLPINTYKEIMGNDIVGRLERYCEETGADTLALVHHQYSLFMRLLKQSTSKKALSQQKIPLLIFSSKMDKEPKWSPYEE